MLLIWSMRYEIYKIRIRVVAVSMLMSDSILSQVQQFTERIKFLENLILEKKIGGKHR